MRSYQLLKKTIILLNFILLLISAYSQQFTLGKKYYYPSEWGNLTINKDNIIKDDIIESSTITFGKYFNIVNTEKIKYIVLSTEIEKISFLTIIKHSNTSEGHFGNWEIYYSVGDNPLFSSSAILQGFNVLSADSYIIEKSSSGEEIRFLPGKVFSTNTNPWAVKKESLLKTVYLNSDKYRVKGFSYHPISYIVVANGFICAEKDYLYELNTRAKNIRISYGNESIEYELKDTANFQSLKLPKSIDPQSSTIIKFEILDYYPGSKYNDIVISGIYYMDVQSNQ